MSKYQETFNYSLTNPEEFWSKAANDVVWIKKFDKVIHADEPPFYRWFKGGKINTCYNALDRHVDEGNGDRTALIYDSAMINTKTKFSYKELRDKTAELAGALQKYGIKKGDRIIIYMPMIPEAVMAMLACGRIGAVHSVVFGGFASNELASRIDDSKARMILTASCGLEPGRTVDYKPLLNEAKKIAKHEVEKTVVFQREQLDYDLEKNDINWSDFISNAPKIGCVECDSNDPAYILYTSGTTGVPKGILRDIAGHIVGLKWTMKNIYDIDPTDVWW